MSVPLLDCKLCNNVILNGHQYLKDGCPILFRTNETKACIANEGPIHFSCWIDDHIKAQECKDLEETWIMNTKDLSDRSRKHCYYWSNHTDEKEDGLLRCPIPGCRFFDRLERHHYIHVNCWIEKHLPVCTRLLEDHVTILYNQ